MSKVGEIFTKSPPGEPYGITRERLGGTNSELISFLFHHYGSNVYVFSYDKDGVRRHTFIDTGYSQYQNVILPILIENGVNLANIERIIITHRHPDHCGLAGLLARQSKAKILAHSNFRSLVDDEIDQVERVILGNFDPSDLKECDIEYLPQSDRNEMISIAGVNFPSLVEPIEIGEAGKLVILACPESISTHSPDQILIIYSPNSCPRTNGEKRGYFCPTEDILFSGDLWLMRGPVFDHFSISNISRNFMQDAHRMRDLSGGSMPRVELREQDSKPKEALKKGFHLVRVKPAHGEEFIGAKIIWYSLLADSDLLFQLGYPMDADKAILKQRDLAPKIAALREQAYTSFIKEVLFWIELGYSLSEISALLVRIYEEQSGGSPSIERDRKERREKLKATLTRLRDDKAESEELHQLAELTLSALKIVS